MATLFVILSCSVRAGQEQNLAAATASTTGTHPYDFIPPGWHVEAIAQGDLNGDGRADLAMVIRQMRREKLLHNPDGLGVEWLDTNPRTLLVLVSQPTGGFTLHSRNDRIVSVTDAPTQDDPFESLSIDNATLRLSLRYFTSAGGWTESGHRFTLRLQDDRLRLIGHDHTTYHRGTGHSRHISVNFLTRRAKLVHEKPLGDEETTACRERWITLPESPAVHLEDIGDGLEYTPILPEESKAFFTQDKP